MRRNKFALALLSISLFCAVTITGLIGSLPAKGQALMPPLLKAASSDELPLPAWGPYSPGDLGPCCLVNRPLMQQFAFPIVIGQQRNESVIHSERDAAGKLHTRSDQVVLLRRGMGLSPVQAANDDRPLPGPLASQNRLARIIDADREGLLWRERMVFAPAGLTQTVAQLTDATGNPVPPAAWGAGEAVVDYFPAFADPFGDGLLVRVALTNRSDRDETYFVDLLGGIDIPTDLFARKDLAVQITPQANTLVVQHPHCAAVFALASDPLPYTLGCYRVRDDYFHPEATVAQRDSAGAVLPYGVLEPTPAAPEPRVKERKQEPKTQQIAAQIQPPVPTGVDNSWGLLRLSGIVVAPGQKVTLFLSVGVAGDSVSASAGAQTLLGIAGDTMPNGSLREGAYTKALRAHNADSLAAGDEAITRLMAQALGNVPLVIGRRLGVPSRQSLQGHPPAVYDPEDGGMIALAYLFSDPMQAAAELNAWFQTNSQSDKPASMPHAVPPTNLFALWELYQRTHSTAMLAKFYPFARRRYQELLAVGRQGTDSWLFSWPSSTVRDPYIPSSFDSGANGKATPDYSAYVIRSARLLEAISRETNQPAAEIAGYARDAQQAAQALNERLWGAPGGRFMPRGAAGSPASPNDASQTSATLADLLPLIAGADALPAERRAALLKSLTAPDAFWSPGGLRELSRTSPAYHAEGAVRPGMSWLIWKGLLDLGETATARKLAEAAVQGYHKAQQAAGGCPEWLDGDTGGAGGVQDYSGDACGLIPLYAAYHLPGTISTGWNVLLLDQKYDAAHDSLHVVFRNLEPATGNTLLCAMGVSGRTYALSGALTATVTADETGVLTLAAPKDPTTQELDIAPAVVTGQTK